MMSLQTTFGGALSQPYTPLGAQFLAVLQDAPQRLAVRCGERVMDYATLGRAVRHCIATLRQQGLRRGDVVGVNIPRSEHYVVLTLAIMMGGYVYLPIASELPRQRRRQIVDIASPALVVSDEVDWLPDGVRRVDQEQAMRANESADGVDLALALRPDELCYMIFTSGTSGEPKAVQIHHGGFFNRLSWARDYYGLTPDDVIMSKTPLTFDPSIQELVLPFIAGCSVLVANPKLLIMPNYLIDCMIEFRVSMLIVVPSLLRQILGAEAFARCTALRHVVCCGEPWSTDLITLFHRVLPGGHIYNGYGPTETTIGTLVYRPARGYAEPQIPIGRPIKGVHVAIVDDAGHNVAPGEIGELLIGGVCVGAGYLGNATSNAAKFRTLSVRGAGDVRFYLSGDLARQLPDGEIVFMGRKDNQVKINGVRIELEEIESVLKRYDLVTNAVVLKGGDHLSDTLHAFVTAEQQLDVQALQRHCAGYLSRQVVPSCFHQVATLPVSQNGKIDRRAVWEQYMARRAASA